VNLADLPQTGELYPAGFALQRALDGRRHPWQTATCGWLFGSPFIQQNHYLIGNDDQKRDICRYQRTEWNATHIPVLLCSGGWRQGPINSPAFDYRTRLVTDVRPALQLAHAEDLATTLVICDQEFYVGALRHTFNSLLNWIDEAVETLDDLASDYIVMGEIGDIFRDMEDRRTINKRVRSRTKKPIRIHERKGEQPFIREVDDQAPTIASIQVDFDPRYDSDGIALIQRARRDLEHRGCHVGVHEHSIPMLYSGQPWYAVDAATARMRGERFLRNGALFDMSGGAR